jgi:type IV fimbrial biogenesis protein FimT
MNSSRGFTLIEVLIALSIMGLLFMLALPSMAKFLQNSQIRTAAESLQNGLQLARAEAVRRNTRIEYVLMAVDPNVGNVGGTPNVAGPNWMVRNFQPGGAYTATDFVQGGGTYQSPNVVIAAPDATIVFNGFGRTDLTGTDTITITYPGAGTCIAAGGQVRCLNITIQIGGQIRMCDPSITDATDTRTC